MVNSMIGELARSALFLFAILPTASAAEPIKLKLAFYTSDQTKIYGLAVKPFVDAVNARGDIEIETYPNGSLGKDQAEQAQLVRNGVADIAFVVLGPTGNRFADHSVMELAGLFDDLREATLVHTRLIASRVFDGYDDFFVIGAFATSSECIHMHPPVATLRDLRGKRIRANNSIETGVLARLGMNPVVLPIGVTAEAISRGTIDGAATSATPLTDFGIGRVATYHYLLRLGPSAMILLMNRKKLESLPRTGQEAIREYSGEWLAARFIEGYERYEKELSQQLSSDPLHKVIFPSEAELDVAKGAFKAVREEWAQAAPHNPHLLQAAEAEILKLRSEH
jgi:TRAP-type C4-dicarboxylate transport system substrate-binding protein